MTNTMNRIDTNTVSYKYAYETFGLIAMDMPAGTERMHYRNIAMEAATGPESGMLMEKLYKSVSSRSNVNFGKIPDSCGDLTAFVRYRQITESLDILRTAFAATRVPEFEEAQKLHDNLVRLRDDFAYGFKMDSQFIKTTYNTMVYSLCEIINLATVIYVDQLKCISQGKPFQYKPYGGLILVENVKKFNDMVSGGDWAQMMNTIRKNPQNLTGGDLNDFTGVLRFLGIGTKVGAAGVVTHTIATSWDAAKKDATAALVAKGAKNTDPGALRVAGTALKKATWDRGVGGKVGTVILILIGLLLLIRSLVCLYWRCKYSIQEILDDNAKLLAASMEVSKDNTATSLEKQQKMYDRMVSWRDKVEKSIMADDANGKKAVHESNKTDMTIVTPSVDDSASAVADAGGFTFG